MYRNEQRYTFKTINRDFKILHLLMIKNKFNYVKNNKNWNNCNNFNFYRINFNDYSKDILKIMEKLYDLEQKCRMYGKARERRDAACPTPKASKESL